MTEAGCCEVVKDRAWISSRVKIESLQVTEVYHGDRKRTLGVIAGPWAITPHAELHKIWVSAQNDKAHRHIVADIDQLHMCKSERYVIYT